MLRRLTWHVFLEWTAIIQRVLSASVTVDKEIVSSIGKGVLVFAAVGPGDTVKEAESLASKVVRLKLWDDENGNRVPNAPQSFHPIIII